MPETCLSAEVELLWDTRCVLGEGLTLDLATAALWFIDIKRPTLYRYGLADGARTSWPLAAQVSAIALPPTGWTPPPGRYETALLSVGARGFAWLTIGEAVTLHPIAHPEAHLPGNRFNDGKAGPDGRFYAGTMDDAEQSAAGSLYALDSSGGVHTLDTGYWVTNGPAFSTDGRTLYENDSALRRTHAFEIAADGSLTAKRVLIEFGDGDGYPDGMTTDRAGRLWIAMWDGARLQRVTADGKRAGHIATPVRRPTSCVLTRDGEIVFTSAAIGLGDSAAPEGGLFRARFSG